MANIIRQLYIKEYKRSTKARKTNNHNRGKDKAPPPH
jgi:hypothetical protein